MEEGRRGEEEHVPAGRHRGPEVRGLGRVRERPGAGGQGGERLAPPPEEPEVSGGLRAGLVPSPFTTTTTTVPGVTSCLACFGCLGGAGRGGREGEGRPGLCVNTGGKQLREAECMSHVTWLGLQVLFLLV